MRAFLLDLYTLPVNANVNVNVNHVWVDIIPIM